MKNKLAARVSLFAANGSVYALNSLYYNFIQIYISRYHPDNVAGILLALGPLVSIFAPILWGYAADRAKSKNAVLAAVILASGVFYFLLMFNQSFIYLAVMLVLCMFFMSPFGGTVDIITLEYTAENNMAYGPYRLTGTLVYGIIPMILTGFTDKNINIIFYAYLVMALIAAASTLTAPKVAGHGSGQKKTSLIPIFKDGTLMFIFFIIAVSQFVWACYLNFFPGYLTSLGHSDTLWGVNVFVTIIGEIPFFLAFNKLFDRFGLKKMILVSLILSIVRYAGLALFTSSHLILLIGLVTGFAVTVFTYCGSVYINKHVAPENKASANNLMYALGNGIPKVLAGVIGGSMNAALGYTPSMLICSALCIAAAAAFVFTAKRMKL